MSTDLLEKKGIALVVLTKSGLQQALRVQHEYKSEAHIYGGQRVFKRQSALLDEDGTATFERVVPLLEGLWLRYKQIVLFFSLGAAVRLIAPLLLGRQSDPDIVVIDDAGHFAISVTTGHADRANALAMRCADILGAQAVITTTSAARGMLAIERMAHANGWYLEPDSALTSVSGSLVNGERVAVLQDPQLVYWKREEEAWMESLVSVTAVQEVIPTACTALLVLSDRLHETLPLAIPTVVCRPASLILGIECQQDVPCDVLDGWLKATLASQRISLQSVVTLATSELTVDAKELTKLAERHRWTIEAHSIEELKSVYEYISQPEQVQPSVVVSNVCEAAAMLSSQGGELLISRQEGSGMSLAVARKPCSSIPFVESQLHFNPELPAS